MSGTLYLVGVGPGDPDYLTLKAVEILGRVPLVAFVQKPGTHSRALQIARPYLSAAARERPIDLPMGPDPAPAQRVYDQESSKIARLLSEGSDVAYLCEGDPFLYGSAIYFFQRLADRFPVVTVPGIPAFLAAAAAAGEPLVSRDQSLRILCGTASEKSLDQALARPDPVVLIKVGRHLNSVRTLLRRHGRARSALVVRNAACRDERITPLENWETDFLPYFALILSVDVAEPDGRAEQNEKSVHSAKASPVPVVVCFTRAARRTAREIARGLGAELVGPEKTEQDRADFLRRCFGSGIPIVGVCATGILVRCLAPVLRDKREEPPVLAVSADGLNVVPVLGGHRGANRLARAVARITGGLAAITTTSESRFSFALDEPPFPYLLADPAPARAAMAALLDGQSLKVTGPADWLVRAGYPVSTKGQMPVIITDRVGPSPDEGKKCLTYFIRDLVAGVGCARGTSAAHIVSLVENTLKQNGLARQSLVAMASIDVKGDEKGLHEAARHLGIEIRFFSAEQLQKTAEKVPNPSPVVKAEVGVASVAEAAAILAGDLIVPKAKSSATRPDSATCAIARTPQEFDLSRYGHPRGRLHLVGIGPGDPMHRTASAVQALSACDHWVGYGLYLDLITDLDRGQERHEFELGEEEKRVRFALELAARGNAVALICSGDAQIYAMAALVFELLETTGPRSLSANARRVSVESHPGISALQMASARSGALLGHDFCAISLSDLLTPASEIEKRIRAAAGGDFVTAFYNPRSARRTRLLEYAKKVFLAHRPPDTPVVVASNLGRAAEKVNVSTLENFDCSQVDMLTIVLFGASGSRLFQRGDGSICTFTPRGYASKPIRSQTGEHSLNTERDS